MADADATELQGNGKALGECARKKKEDKREDHGLPPLGALASRRHLLRVNQRRDEEKKFSKEYENQFDRFSRPR